MQSYPGGRDSGEFDFVGVGQGVMAFAASPSAQVLVAMIY